VFTQDIYYNRKRFVENKPKNELLSRSVNLGSKFNKNITKHSSTDISIRPIGKKINTERDLKEKEEVKQ